jgi:hypothetical protein
MASPINKPIVSTTRGSFNRARQCLALPLVLDVKGCWDVVAVLSPGSRGVSTLARSVAGGFTVLDRLYNVARFIAEPLDIVQCYS